MPADDSLHVSHDPVCCGDNVVLANNVNIAGHVIIEDWVIIEGQVGVQQFTRIGQHAFIAGGSLVRKSVPPFIRAAREPLSYIGLNRVGLERRGFDVERVATACTDVYRILFVKGLNLRNAVEDIEANVSECADRNEILDFIADTEKTGILRSFQQVNGNKVNH